MFQVPNLKDLPFRVNIKDKTKNLPNRSFHGHCSSNIKFNFVDMWLTNRCTSNECLGYQVLELVDYGPEQVK